MARRTRDSAFSLTKQAVQLGYLPRMPILHTSSETIGQVYVPTVNWAMASPRSSEKWCVRPRR